MSNLRKINPIDTELSVSEDHQATKIDLIAAKFKNLLDTHDLIQSEEELDQLNTVLDTKMMELETLREQKKAKKIQEQKSEIQAQTIQAKKNLSALDRLLDDF